jgi:hypothetical protein
VRNGFDPEAYLTSVLHRFAEHLDQPHRRATAMESFPTLVWRRERRETTTAFNVRLQYQRYHSAHNSHGIRSRTSRFRRLSAFASWLGICPEKQVSGGKILYTPSRKVKITAAIAQGL